MLRTIVLLLCCLIALRAGAQVNAYAEVMGVAGTSLTLSGAMETYDTFEDGEEAIIMQMQDDVAGTNLSNNSAFGNLFNISSAGRWEVVTMVSHTEALGLPVSVVVSAPLTFTYHFGVKQRVQLISFPRFGAPDYTTTEPITAVPWNGVAGGVVALQVGGILDLAHDIRADYGGFRGGVPSANFNSTCAPTVYASNSANYAEKGEGLQRVSNVNQRYARAKFIHGAGGGNPKNAGGGGGGHWTNGGNGGGGYTCVTGAGGVGGIGLAAHVYWSRFFMGGGAGGGQQNNSLGGAGGAGGGIVILYANELRTTGPCPTLYISANGANGGSSIGPVPDGAGGGGAGGTVYLYVNTFNVDTTCALVCQANGGHGGQVICTGNPGDPPPVPGNWLDYGGGGGGGAQGAVMCNSGAQAGVSAGTAPGTGGTHDGFGGRAMDAPGPANAGVTGFGAPISLPIELLYFKATGRQRDVLLEWATVSEQNTLRFDVERSRDLEDWSFIGAHPAAGHSTMLREYELIDGSPLHGTSYYRLIEIDLDSEHRVFGPVAVERAAGTVIIAPQPADDELHVLTGSEDAVSYRLLAADGRIQREGTLVAANMSIDVRQLAAGSYILLLSSGDRPLFSGPIIIAR